MSALSASEPTNTTLIITWEPSSPCPATEYVVVYTLTNRDQCETVNESTELVLPEDTTTVTLSNLLQFSNYTVSVRGRNSEGDGPVEMLEWTTAGFGKNIILIPYIVMFVCFACLLYKLCRCSHDL